MTMVRFVGGPLDGFAENKNLVDAFASLLPGRTRDRLFVMVPSLEQCRRILRGELRSDEITGPLHAYDRTFTADAIECRFTEASDFDQASSTDCANQSHALPHEDGLPPPHVFTHVAAKARDRIGAAHARVDPDTGHA